MVQLTLFDTTFNEVYKSKNDSIFSTLSVLCEQIAGFQKELLSGKEYMVFTKENFSNTKVLLKDADAGFQGKLSVKYRMLIELVRQEFVVLKEWMSLLGVAGLMKADVLKYQQEIIYITKELSRVRDLIR